MRHARFLLAALLSAVPAGVQAQALRCAIPDRIAMPRPDLPNADQPARTVAIGGYTLAITWTPGYCRNHRRDADDRLRCASGNRFGFALHGLWPDGKGAVWPQYCAAAPLLDRRVIAANLCATPSVQLLQHEFAKHGTCMGITPTAYFARARWFYDRLRYPDMTALSYRSLTIRQLAVAIASANRGMQADMMRITTDRRGWLDEVWFCLDKAFRYRSCPAHQGGAELSSRVRIWRGVR